MYNAFRTFCERLLRIPADPHAPPGDEASTQIYRAARNYYRYLLLIWAAGSALAILPPLAVAAAFVVVEITGSDPEPAFALVIAVIGILIFFEVVVSILWLAVIRLNYEKRWYIVTDRSLRVRQGVVGVQEMTVTFANIQNISIEQGPVQRLLSIADLRVDTAGGGAASTPHHGRQTNLHTAWFRGIDNATHVRELIQQRLRQWKDAGLGDHDDAAHAPHAPAPTSSDFLEALREVHAEAQALRRTATPS